MRTPINYTVTFVTARTAVVVHVAHPHDSEDKPLPYDEDLRDIIVDIADEITWDDLGVHMLKCSRAVKINNGIMKMMEVKQS